MSLRASARVRRRRCSILLIRRNLFPSTALPARSRARPVSKS